MSIHISLDPRREIKKRIELKKQLEENLKDARAEYDELIKMDPIAKARGSGDIKENGNSGINNTDKVISMTLRKKALKKKIGEYEVMLHDYNRGWNLLNDTEKEILSMRFIDNLKQEAVAKRLNFERKTIQRKEQEALRKMETELLDI